MNKYNNLVCDKKDKLNKDNLKYENNTNLKYIKENIKLKDIVNLDPHINTIKLSYLIIKNII